MNCHTLMGEWSGPGAALTAPDLADPAERTNMPNRTCSVDGCERPLIARGLYSPHYQKAKWDGVLGSYPRVRATGSVKDRLLTKRHVTPDGCWEWTGCRTWGGYGTIRINRKIVVTHRAAWEAWRGPIPEGLFLDHLCRNRACFNPDHLEPVTFRENVRRGSALITECPSGHPYDEANTHYDKNGHRHCRACSRAAARRYYYEVTRPRLGLF